jgi:hypothetical protein
MPRNGSGTYTLPTGNPVVSGTTIESSWANTTLSDIATELTNSLSRTGAGGMTGAFRAANGTSTVPGIAWADETGTGFYRAGTSDTRFVVQTAEVQKWTASGTNVTGTFASTGAATVPALTATGNVSFDGGTFVFNDSGADKDARFEGDTDANLLFLDASADTVGIGTSSPLSKLHVNGNFVRVDQSGANQAYFGNAADLITGAPAGAAIRYDGTALRFSASSTQVAMFDSSGNLGIGTSSPGVKLEVAGDARLTGANPSFSAVPTSTGFYIDNRGVGKSTIFRVSSASAIDTTAVTLDSSGNLGLGVTPSAWVAGSRALQAGNPGSAYTALSQATGGDSNLTSNVYLSAASTWTAIASLGASRYQLDFGSHKWYTAPSGTAGNAITFTQAMTLDASGVLSVGTPLAENATGVYALPAGELRVKDSTEDGTSQISIYNNNTTNDSEQFFVAMSAADVNIGNRRTDGGALKFFTFNTERARITSGGDLLVGDTTQPTSADNRLAVIGTRGIDCKNTGGATAPNITAWNNATTGDNIFVSFRTETTDTARGSISYNRAGGLVAYNTTSDYRAKDILGPVADPGATIDALKVYNGKMKGATVERPMLVAHEAQAVAPYSVTGEKDAVNDNGDPVFQQMDVSSLVPLLLAEIQSLRARVAALEA